MEKTKKKGAFAQIFSVFANKRVRNFAYLLLIVFAAFSMLCIDRENTIRKEYFSFLDNNFVADFMNLFGIERYNVTSSAWVWFVMIMTVALIIVLGNIIAPSFVAKKVKDNPDLLSTEKKTRAFYNALFYGVLLLIAAAIIVIAYFAGAFNLYNGNSEESSPFISLLIMLGIFLVFLIVILLVLGIIFSIIRFIVLLATGKLNKKEPVAETAAVAEEQKAAEPAKAPAVEPAAEPVAEPVAEQAEKPDVAAAKAPAQPVINDIKGRKVYQKSFMGKISQSTKEQKEYYGELKNYLLSFKRVNSRVSWNFDSFNVGREKIVKIAFRGQTMVACFALNPKDYEKTKYHAHDLGGKRKFADTPAMVKIRSARGVKFAKELIDIVCANLGTKKNFSPETYKFNYMSDIKLVENGLAKEVYLKVLPSAK